MQEAVVVAGTALTDLATDLDLDLMVGETVLILE
jgi:hypothetical protein